MTFPCLPAATAFPVPWKCQIEGSPFNTALKAGSSPASLKIVKSLRAEWWEWERLAQWCLSYHHAVVLQVWGSSLKLQRSAFTFTPCCSGPQEQPDFNSGALCSVALNGRSCWNGASWLYSTITLILFDAQNSRWLLRSRATNHEVL